MGETRQNELRLAVIVAALASTILLIDMLLPLGVAGGVPYVALVLLGWWFGGPRHIFVLAAVSSVLTVVGYFYSPDGGIEWVVLTNRFLAFFAIWVTAALLAKVKGAESALRIAHEELKQRAAASLRESEERFRAVVNYSPAKIHIKDADGHYILLNREAEKLFGVSDEEARGKTTHEIFPEEQANSFAAHDRVVLATGQTIKGEEEWLREDGVHTFLTVKFPIRDSAGNITAVGAIGTDITEHKHAEEALQESERRLQERIVELEEAQCKLEQQGADLVHLAGDLTIARDQAEAASRAKSEFLATMSHELRTPLNAIIGFSEIMKSEMLGPVGSAQYLDYANDINYSGQHLLNLINDVLDLSKLEAGVDELQEEDVDIPEIIGAVTRLVRQRAEKEGVELELDVAEASLWLRADERKLKQILVNLLINAIKFTGEGGRVTLRTSCSADSGYVFRIIDTGIGMSPEDITKALSKFGQVDSDLNREYEGSGLGLPLAKALIELHGGSIEVQSQVGVGTAVTVRFPATRIVDGIKKISLN